MIRRLNDYEYFAFLDDVHVFVPYDSGDPKAYDPPSWGGVVLWRGLYVLVLPKPDGTVELTDITSGVPVGDAIIPPQDYLSNVETRQTTNATIYGLTEGAMEGLKNAAQLPKIVIDWGPIALIVVGVLVLMYGLGPSLRHGE